MSDIENQDDFTPLPDDPDDLVQPIDTQPKRVDSVAAAEKKPALPPERELTQEEIDKNLITEDDYIDLLEKDPTVSTVSVAIGWDQRAMEEDLVDLDLSCFLLNKENETREDGDFVFYNQEIALEGAVKHNGDNRTGAGDGDDENIFLDLNGIPFDVLKVQVVVSLYDEEREGKSFDLIKNMFVRLVNEADKHELLRYIPAEEKLAGKNAVKILDLIREGPKWFVRAPCETTTGYLNEIAKEYGMIIREDVG